MNTCIYPIFQEASEYTLNANLKKILLDCSNSKFPKDFVYDAKSHSLFVGSLTVKLSENPCECFCIIRDLLQDLNSSEKKVSSTPIQSFKEIKQKSQKESLIQEYILNFSQNYSLTKAETKKFEHFLDAMFLISKCTPNSVHIQDEKIVAIDGIEFDQQTRNFICNNSITIKSVSSEKSNLKHDIDRKIEKYLNENSCETI